VKGKVARNIKFHYFPFIFSTHTVAIQFQRVNIYFHKTTIVEKKLFRLFFFPFSHFITIIKENSEAEKKTLFEWHSPDTAVENFFPRRRFSFSHARKINEI
jgi:hypothetical protein